MAIVTVDGSRAGADAQEPVPSVTVDMQRPERGTDDPFALLAEVPAAGGNGFRLVQTIPSALA
ncbi:MAG TPA: hypothetical protein VF937_08700, partial [Chloroflexota bacterium]